MQFAQCALILNYILSFVFSCIKVQIREILIRLRNYPFGKLNCLNAYEKCSLPEYLSVTVLLIKYLTGSGCFSAADTGNLLLSILHLLC